MGNNNSGLAVILAVLGLGFLLSRDAEAEAPTLNGNAFPWLRDNPITKLLEEGPIFMPEYQVIDLPDFETTPHGPSWVDEIPESNPIHTRTILSGITPVPVTKEIIDRFTRSTPQTPPIRRTIHARTRLSGITPVPVTPEILARYSRGKLPSPIITESEEMSETELEENQISRTHISGIKPVPVTQDIIDRYSRGK